MGSQCGRKEQIVSTPEIGPPNAPLEEDSPEARLVGDYLDLVERYGTDAAETRQFLDSHQNAPALREWAGVVSHIDQEARSKRRRRTTVGIGVTVGSLVLLLLASFAAVIGMQRSIRLAQVEPELSKAKERVAELQTDKAQEQKARAELEHRYNELLAKSKGRKGPDPVYGAPPGTNLPPQEALAIRTPSLPMLPPPDESAELTAGPMPPDESKRFRP
jgi:hypothetical protein